jgi:hypothetical protein
VQEDIDRTVPEEELGEIQIPEVSDSRVAIRVDQVVPRLAAAVRHSAAVGTSHSACHDRGTGLIEESRSSARARSWRCISQGAIVHELVPIRIGGSRRPARPGAFGGQLSSLCSVELPSLAWSSMASAA